MFDLDTGLDRLEVLAGLGGGCPRMTKTARPSPASPGHGYDGLAGHPTATSLPALSSLAAPSLIVVVTVGF